MNTICIQLTDKQLSDLATLLDIVHADLQSDMDKAVDDESAADTQSLLEAHESIHDALTSRTYLWSSGCGHLELDIPAEAVDDIAQPGDNEAAVRSWLEGEETNYLRAQIERLDHNVIRTYLTEAGIDGVREKSEADCRMYLLWMACHDINDEAGVGN